MATSKAQRVGILIIMVATVVGTLGSFAVMALSQRNQAEEAARLQKIQADFERENNAYREKIDAQAAELSTKYYGQFAPYAERVGEFDRDGVEKIVVNDLVVGDGKTIGDDTEFAAYYIGWNPNGKVFDQSIDGKKLKYPLLIEPSLKEASLIDGWKEAMKGMKIGGVREITIPSDKAYGEQGQGDAIPPNTPIKFVVMAIATPKTIQPPEIPMELYEGMGAY